MRGAPAWSLLLLLGACNAQIAAGNHKDGVGGSDAGPDAPTIDAGSIDAPLGKFGLAAKLGVAATTTSSEDDATLSSTALEMIFAIDMGKNGKDLYYTSRPTTSDPWTQPQLAPFSDTAKSDESPRFSPDDKTLYFASGHGNADGTLDVYSVKRDTVGSNTWKTPVKDMTVSTAATSEKWYMPCGTQFLMVQLGADNKPHFVGGALGTAGALVPELNGAASAETGTFFTADCKTVYFASTRTTPTMIHVAHRDTVDAKWQTPVPVTDLTITGGNGDEEDPWMSPDGRTFVFASDIAGAANKDVYITTR